MQRFPFHTFDDIAELGLEVHVYCPACYRQTGPIDLSDDRLRGRVFTGTRFVCSIDRTYGSAHPPRNCGRLGQIIIKPPARDLILPNQSIPWCQIACARCVPQWEISQAAKHRPPWNTVFAKPGVKMGCPACRSALTTVWHGGLGIPHTDGYRKQNPRAPLP